MAFSIEVFVMPCFTTLLLLIPYKPYANPVTSFRFLSSGTSLSYCFLRLQSLSHYFLRFQCVTPHQKLKRTGSFSEASVVVHYRSTYRKSLVKQPT